MKVQKLVLPMVAVATIVVGVSADVILDDFNHSYATAGAAQSYLGAARGISWSDSVAGSQTNGDDAYVGGSYWYAYAASGSKVTTPGDADVTGDFSAAITGGSLSVKMSNAYTTDWGYASVEVPLGATIISADSTTEAAVDLSSMTGIDITYTSDKPVWLSFGTDDVNAIPGDWKGAWGIALLATTGPKTITIPVASIVAEEYSPLADSVVANAATWNWANAAKSVKTITFNAPGDSAQTVVTNLSVDNLVFKGMDYKTDFGITWRDPVTPIAVEKGASVKGFALSQHAQSGTVAVALTLPLKSDVKATLLTPAGRQVAQMSLAGTAGVNRFNMKTTGLAEGLYLLRVTAAGVEQTARVSIK